MVQTQENTIRPEFKRFVDEYRDELLAPLRSLNWRSYEADYLGYCGGSWGSGDPDCPPDNDTYYAICQVLVESPDRRWGLQLTFTIWDTDEDSLEFDESDCLFYDDIYSEEIFAAEYEYLRDLVLNRLEFLCKHP